MEHQARIFDRLTTSRPVNFPRGLPPRKMQFLFRSVKRGHESSFIAEEESRPSRANEKEREKREDRERERKKKKGEGGREGEREEENFSGEEF